MRLLQTLTPYQTAAPELPAGWSAAIADVLNAKATAAEAKLRFVFEFLRFYYVDLELLLKLK